MCKFCSSSLSVLQPTVCLCRSLSDSQLTVFEDERQYSHFIAAAFVGCLNAFVVSCKWAQIGMNVVSVARNRYRDALKQVTPNH